ncbi:MAG: acyltransferase [Christensenellaceae bacterium]|nr:acyltransferase [Christensenellaceae bacterium]
MQPASQEKPFARIPALDGIRSLLMLLLMLFHFWQQDWISMPSLVLGPFHINGYLVAALGFLGVEVLCVLSGFLLYLPLAGGEKLRPGAFFFKRFVRIYPSYLLALLVCAIFPLSPFPSLQDLLFQLGGHLLCLNLHPAFFFDRFNGTFWFISLEFCFTLLFPLLVPAMRKAPGLTLFFCALFSILFRAWMLRLSGNTRLWQNQLPAMLDCFVAGMFTAYAVQLCKELPRRFGGALFFAGVLLFAYVFIAIGFHLGQQVGNTSGTQYYQSLYRPLTILAGCLMVGGAALAPKAFQSALGCRFFAFVASISYNLFLWHQWISVKIKAWFWGFTPGMLPNEYAAAHPGWEFFHLLVSFALSFLLASAVTFLVERPLIRLLRSQTARKSGAAALPF